MENEVKIMNFIMMNKKHEITKKKIMDNNWKKFLKPNEMSKIYFDMIEIIKGKCIS